MGLKGYQTMVLPVITGKEITVQERIFPEITEGLVFENVKSRINEHWTSPPKRYTESTLLAAMERAGNEDYEDKSAEKKGIGSPATRAGIIETIIKRGYVQRTGKSLVPYAKGISLVNTVPEEIKSPKLTAQWEEKLKAIEKGNMTSGEFMNGIAGFVCGLIQKYSNDYLRLAPLTSEQLQSNALLETDINNAVVENMATFVTEGVTDESWEKFVNMFEGMGVSDYIQMYQDAIDTMELE